jgi:hypothetical protein
MTEKYNGYTNYETWCLALWLDNEQGQYQMWQERSKVLEVYELGQELKAYYQDEINPLINNASFYSDLLNSALSEINWREVAEKLKEDE